jgi:hypothetical protein
VRFPCVHAAATTPVQQMGVVLAQNHPSVSAFPDSTFGSACTSTFSRFAQRLLALRPAHSRSHQSRDRYPGASDISSPPCLPRLLPAGAGRRAGLAPAGKAPPCHGARGEPSFADYRADGEMAPKAGPTAYIFAPLFPQRHIQQGANAAVVYHFSKMRKRAVSLVCQHICDVGVALAPQDPPDCAGPRSWEDRRNTPLVHPFHKPRITSHCHRVGSFTVVDPKMTMCRLT